MFQSVGSSKQFVKRTGEKKDILAVYFSIAKKSPVLILIKSREAILDL